MKGSEGAKKSTGCKAPHEPCYGGVAIKTNPAASDRQHSFQRTQCFLAHHKIQRNGLAVQSGVVRFSPDRAWAAALARDTKDRLHFPCSVVLLHTMDGDTHAGPEQERWMRELQKLRGCSTLTGSWEALRGLSRDMPVQTANGKLRRDD